MKTLLLTAALVSLGFATAANATVWTIWSDSYTIGLTGAKATGALGGVTVSYDGEINKGITNPACGGICFGYPSWTPASTYADGTVVTSAPPPADGTIQLVGGAGTSLDTITFSTPVTDPVIAIWSLGRKGTTAEFVFSAGDTPVFVAGGKSTEYGGEPIIVSGNTVGGQEGNGTVEFVGTYTSISFKTPEKEGWYGFTVGLASAIPESSTWTMFPLGFAGLGYAGFRRNTKANVGII